MTLLEVHRVLSRLFFELTQLHGHLPPMSTESAYEIGLATGQVSKAKALVGRDIDDFIAGEQGKHDDGARLDTKGDGRE